MKCSRPLTLNVQHIQLTCSSHQIQLKAIQCCVVYWVEMGLELFPVHMNNIICLLRLPSKKKDYMHKAKRKEQFVWYSINLPMSGIPFYTMDCWVYKLLANKILERSKDSKHFTRTRCKPITNFPAQWSPCCRWCFSVSSASLVLWYTLNKVIRISNFSSFGQSLHVFLVKSIPLSQIPVRVESGLENKLWEVKPCTYFWLPVSRLHAQSPIDGERITK